jgi:hypothetical protein
MSTLSNFDALNGLGQLCGPGKAPADRDRTPVANMLDPSITYLLASGMILLAFGLAAIDLP